MTRDILKFYGHARGLVDDDSTGDISLGAFLSKRKYSAALIDDHILPMCAAIWSTTIDEIKDYPLAAFIRFFSSHGLLDIAGDRQWRTVDGGSRNYVERLTASLDSVQLGSGVRKIMRGRQSVIVEDDVGGRRTFDDVVIATHADQALTMLTDPDEEERRLLGAFRYSDNRAYLHNDDRLMPHRRRVWSSWNYIGSGSDDRALCVTYWMNRLQSLDEGTPLFVTLNPHREPRTEAIRQIFDYSHPLFDAQALRAQRDLWRLQGRRRTWFCGSYFGFGFHEDALQAGLHVAEQAGGVRRPWTVEGESDRISLPPQARLLEAAE